jgi:hypothetical protein
MYQPASRRSLLTSLELFPEDDRLCVVTTKEILWLDRRFSQRPLMSFKHGLSSDRTLNVRSLKTKTGKNISVGFNGTTRTCIVCLDCWLTYFRQGTLPF